MGGSGGTKVEAPKPSEEELALRREQTALAQQQRQIIEETMRQQNLLQPILMENQGYRPIYSQVDPAAVERAQQIDARLGELQGLVNTAKPGVKLPAYVGAGQEQQVMQRYGLTPEQFDQQYYGGVNNEGRFFMLRDNAGMLPGTDISGYGAEMANLQRERGTLADRLTAGRITGYELLPEVAAQQKRLRELQGQQQEITGMMQERTLKALRGELPIDPAIERWISEGRQTLGDQLRANLGSGYLTSTPGIQALAEFDKRANEIRSAAQRDAIYNTSQLQQAGTQFGSSIDQMRLGNVTGIQTMPFGGAQGLGAAGAALQGPLSGYLQDRNMQFQAAVQNAQQANQPSGFGQLLGSVVGGIGGFMLGGPAGAMAGASLGGGAGKVF